MIAPVGVSGEVAGQPLELFRLHVPILLIGAVGIAFEIALMRVFSIAQWHHFAYMIISVAMLGFAVSGTAIALLRHRLEGRERGALAAASLALSVSLLACYATSQRVPFDTFRLMAEPRQIRHLATLYLVLAVPFFLVSWCITLGLLVDRERVGRVYAFNMAGSGLGAIAVVGLLFLAPPSNLPWLLTIPAAAAYGLIASGLPRRWMLGLGLPLALLLLIDQPVRLSEYKGLSHALRLPDAEIIAETQSPISLLTAVSSPAIRETPGQLSGYPMGELGELPRQIALYFDGGSASVVSRFDGSLEAFAFLDYVTGALPYRLVDRPRVLVVGSGGGIEVLSALQHGALEVTALEVDPGVPRMLGAELRDFSGRLYERDDVRLVLSEGRGYLGRRSEADIDLIQVALLDSFNAASAGVHALAESYLYTVEAIGLYLSRLTPEGVLSITRWLKTPPRDAIKLFATMVEAAERFGIAEPARHLAVVRSWNTATLVLSRSPLSDEQVQAIRTFAGERGLDVSYLPGIEPGETNRFTVLEEEIYHEAALAVLSDGRERFYDDYAFHVRPATDDRPYFFRFFRWRSVPLFLEAARGGWFNFVEWGYVALLATVVQAAAIGLVLVILPLALFARGIGRRARFDVALYFGALGFAFMFLEIAFIQRLMLFLAYPVYAVAVVLASFLIFAGLGSYTADRRMAGKASDGAAWIKLVRVAAVAIASVGLAYLFVLPAAFRLGAGWPDVGKILFSVALLAPLCFFMGIPFPAGLQLLADRRARLVPWAWGLNGAASVLGATLATLVAVHFGFRAVVLAAFGLYGTAALSVRRIAA